MRFCARGGKPSANAFRSAAAKLARVEVDSERGVNLFSRYKDEGRSQPPGASIFFARALPATRSRRSASSLENTTVLVGAATLAPPPCASSAPRNPSISA